MAKQENGQLVLRKPGTPQWAKFGMVVLPQRKLCDFLLGLVGGEVNKVVVLGRK